MTKTVEQACKFTPAIMKMAVAILDQGMLTPFQVSVEVRKRLGATMKASALPKGKALAETVKNIVKVRSERCAARDGDAPPDADHLSIDQWMDLSIHKRMTFKPAKRLEMRTQELVREAVSQCHYRCDKTDTVDEFRLGVWGSRLDVDVEMIGTTGPSYGHRSDRWGYDAGNDSRSIVMVATEDGHSYERREFVEPGLRCAKCRPGMSARHLIPNTLFSFAVRRDWIVQVYARGLAVVNGRLTLNADESLSVHGATLYRCRWASQASGHDLALVDGFIGTDPDGFGFHIPTKEFRNGCWKDLAVTDEARDKEVFKILRSRGFMPNSKTKSTKVVLTDAASRLLFNQARLRSRNEFVTAVGAMRPAVALRLLLDAELSGRDIVSVLSEVLSTQRTTAQWAEHVRSMGVNPIALLPWPSGCEKMGFPSFKPTKAMREKIEESIEVLDSWFEGKQPVSPMATRWAS
jgi:hypothetical protein